VFAQVPWESVRNVFWRADVVRLDGDPKANVSMSAFRESGAVDTSMEHVDFFWLENVCLTQSQSLPPNAHAGSGQLVTPADEFRRSPYLRIKISTADPRSQVNAVDWVSRQIARSLSVWRRVCVNCDANNFAVLDFDDRIFLLATVYEPLKRWADLGGKPNLLGMTPNSPEVVDWANTLNRIGSRALPTLAYYGLSKNDAALKYLCDAPEDKLDPAWLPMRKTPVCGGAGEVGAAMPLEIEFTEKGTWCGKDPDIVACRAESRLLQLNAKDYSFDNAGSLVPIGIGSRRANLSMVIMHEVGHWLGICHTDQPGGVMGEHLSGLRCIDQAAFDAFLATSRTSPEQCPLPSALRY
jgi:hypothetical protein